MYVYKDSNNNQHLRIDINNKIISISVNKIKEMYQKYNFDSLQSETLTNFQDIIKTTIDNNYSNKAYHIGTSLKELQNKIDKLQQSINQIRFKLDLK